MNKFSLKLTKDPQEIRQAQKLRYEVFNREMRAGFNSSHINEIDVDEFDNVCDHVIIIDNQTKQIIGTYRLLLDDVANQNQGFYSQKHFDLSQVKTLKGGQLLEVGRSCIHQNYRKRSVLTKLWQGIAQYANQHQVRYIFGCISVFEEDLEAISQFYGALKALGHLGSLDVSSIDPLRSVNIIPGVEITDPKAIIEQLPVLFKGYLSIGIKVCGMPVANPLFRSIVFFVLLDIEDMNFWFRERFFKRTNRQSGEQNACN